MDDPRRTQSAHSTAVIVVAVALMAIGLVMVASTGASVAQPSAGSASLRNPLLRQLIFAAASAAVMLITARVTPVLFESPFVRRRLGQVLLAIALVLLVAAFVPGLMEAHRGSQRWLRLGSAEFGISFQPSAFAKLALVAFLASLLGTGEAGPRSLGKGLLPAALGTGACVLLVGKEDFGTAVLLALVAALTLFVAGCRLRHLLGLGSIGAVAMTALLFAEPYRLQRLTAYRDFWQDPLGAGYQPIQSLTAISSGGWLGVGLGAGVQKYGYLPDSRTDFIFSIICEEAGVLGGALVLALFCVLVWLGLKAMTAAPTRFERLLAFGLTATIGLQAAMHVAVVTVVTPTTGISLPLVSAGGSGLMTFCMAIGLLSAVAARGVQGDLFAAVREDSRRSVSEESPWEESAAW